MVLQPDFHGCGSISRSFARWIPEPPWFPVEPDLLPVTPSYNCPPPLDTSESRLKSIFDVSQIVNSCAGTSGKIPPQKPTGKLEVVACTRKDAWNSQNCHCLPRCASACIVLIRFATILVLFLNKSIHGVLHARPRLLLVRFALELK